MAHETPHTKFPRDIKGHSSDYGGSDVDEALLEASQQVHHAIADDAGTDYGSDFDSEADEAVTRILAELDGARVVTEPLIEEENESGRKRLVHIPNVSSQRSSARTRLTSWHTVRESAGSVGAAEETVPIDIDLPDLSSSMFLPSCSTLR